MALVTGIPPQAWHEAGTRAVLTAEELLEDLYARRSEADTGEQMRG